MSFVAWELRAREPMLPMHFFRNRAFAAGNTAIFLTFASLFAAVFFYAQLLQVGLGYGPLGTGLRLLPWTATFMTVAPVAGALADRIGERPLMVTGLSLQAVGMAWLAVIAEPGIAYSELLAPFILAGVGVSLAIPAAQNSVVGSLTIDALGKAAGANSMMRELGGVFGIALAVAVFAGAGSFASAATFIDGFSPAIGVAAGLALLGAVAGLALPGRRRSTAPTLVAVPAERRANPLASPAPGEAPGSSRTGRAAMCPQLSAVLLGCQSCSVVACRCGSASISASVNRSVTQCLWEKRTVWSRWWGEAGLADWE